MILLRKSRKPRNCNHMRVTGRGSGRIDCGPMTSKCLASRGWQEC